MKKSLISILFILLVLLVFSNSIYAYSGELDPDSLISFPGFAWDGEGKITIYDKTNYQLYYQVVQISDSAFNSIKKIQADGKVEIDKLKEQIDKLKTEADNLYTIYREKGDEYNQLRESGAGEEELEAAETAYTEAETNYQNKVDEHNNKVTENNNKVKQINNAMLAYVPDYVEANWIKTLDRSFKIDLTGFNGKKNFVVWAKLVTADGKVCYDQTIYTTEGTKVDEVKVTGITLDKKEISIKEGSSYTLNATISPSNATNKSIIWTSDNEKIAKVEYGKITGVSEGITTIKATTRDGNYIASCKVTVTKKDESEKKSETSSDKKDTTKKDNTTASGKLPQTGINSMIICIFIITTGVLGIVFYKKYNSYKDIK